MNNRSPKNDCLQLGGVFILISAYLLYRTSYTAAMIVGALGLALIVTAWVWDAGARLFASYWSRLTGVIAMVNTTILLGLVYFIIITPTGFLVRLFKRRVTVKNSFWRTPEQGSISMKDQF